MFFTFNTQSLKTTAIIGMTILITFVMGCSSLNRSAIGIGTPTTTNAGITSTPSTSILTPVEPCSTPPITSLTFPFKLPLNTLIIATPSVHGAPGLALCTPKMMYASIDQFMLKQMKDDGWHMYDPLTDKYGMCAIITLKWIKGNTALYWTMSTYNPYPNSETVWGIHYCTELNVNP